MSPSPGLDIRFFAAPAAFADCFSAIYRLEIALPEGESVSDLLLPEWGNLRFISAGSPGGVELDGQHFGAGSFFATGPTSRAKRISVGAIRLWGIGLLPLGWANFVRAPASQLADGVFDGARHPAFAHFAGVWRRWSRSKETIWPNMRCFAKPWPNWPGRRAMKRVSAMRSRRWLTPI